MLIWLFGVKTKSVFLSFFPIFCFQAEVDMHFIAVENFTSAPLVRITQNGVRASLKSHISSYK